MMMRHECPQAVMCRCASGRIVPAVLLLAASIMVGCPEQQAEQPVNQISDADEVVEFNLTGIRLTTNGVPISIDTGQIQLNAVHDGVMMVSSFPEDGDENDDDDPDPEDEVTLVFVVIPIADEPAEPSRHFVVNVNNQDQNWIVLTRQPGYPRRYQYQVIPRVHNGTRPTPGDYLLVAVKIGPDTQLPEPPGELVMLTKSVAGLKFVRD